jgi:cysteinyl-tRNA synthetase
VSSRCVAAASHACFRRERGSPSTSCARPPAAKPTRAVARLGAQRLGEAAAGGLRDPKELLAPLVESLITLRGELRAAKAWELADRVRDRLIAARIELRDTPAGTVWEIRES